MANIFSVERSSQESRGFSHERFKDTYWIKGNKEKIKFEDINLFNHSLSNAFVDVSLRGKQLAAQNAEMMEPLDAAGDVSTVGVAPKAWILKNREFYL